MKTYKVFSPINVGGKRYKVGSFVDLTEEQAQKAKGAVIEVPESIKDKVKTSKGKSKDKEIEKVKKGKDKESDEDNESDEDEFEDNEDDTVNENN